MGDWLVTAVALGVGGVAKKHTRERARRKLMRGGGSRVRITPAAEDAKVIICGRCTVEEVMRRVGPTHTTQADVDEESLRGKSIRPESWGHVCVEQKDADAVVEGTKHPFSTNVLWRSVWTREAEDGAMGGEQ
jgi:hypothetical protein